MGKKSSSPPPAPDPRVAAEAQAAANKDAILASAAVNRINEFTPWGNLIYTRTPAATPVQPAVDPAAAEAWAAYDAALRKYNASSAGSGGMSGEGVNHVPTGPRGPAPKMPTMPRPGTQPVASTDPTAGIDQWTRTVELTPSQQRQLDAQNALAEALLGKASQRVSQITDESLDFSGLPALPGDFSARRQRVEDALFGRGPRVWTLGSRRRSATWRRGWRTRASASAPKPGRRPWTT